MKGKTLKELFDEAYSETSMAQSELGTLFARQRLESDAKETERILQHLNKAICAWQEFHNRTCGHEPAKHG